jgi:hypothetical protein
VSEFYEEYYGESAGPMRAYHEMLEKRMAAVDVNIPGDAWVNGVKVYDSAFLVELRSQLDQALVLAGTDVTRSRIERHVNHLDYSCRLLDALESKQRGDSEVARDRMNAILDDWKSYQKRWYGILSGIDMDRFLGSRVGKLSKDVGRT